jgi:tetratricopeptide (TPR) repeat protein
MKSISTAAFAAAMVAGATGLAFAPPAFAKKKEEAPTGPQYTQAVAVAANKAKIALLAKDLVTAEAAVGEAEAAAKTDDDKYISTFLRYALVSQKISDASAGTNGAFDPAPMIAPLDGLIVNPKTPADMLPKFEYSRATIAYDAKDWARAIRLFQQAQQHGSTEKNLGLYLAKSKVQGGDAAGGMADLEKLTAAGTQTEDIYKYGVAQSAAAGLKPQTISWLKRWLIAYPTMKTWRDALGYYGLTQNPVDKLDKKTSIDLFRLMRQTKSLADENYYEEYAQKVMDVGLPDETKAVIAEGKANGKIPGAGNSNIQALVQASNAQVANEGSFAGLESKSAASATGALSQQTGDAFLGRGDYAKAIGLYKQALAKGGVNNDEVNTHLGIALALSGDKAGAKAAFGAVTTAPRSNLAGFWITWIDNPPTS